MEAAYFRWLHPATAATDQRTDAILRNHLDLGTHRIPGHAALRVHRGGHDTALGPAVQIVNDDMPLLVDAITSALRRLDAEITDIVHPVFDVSRAEDGTLQAITLEHALGDSSTAAESWIHIQLGPTTTDTTLDTIETALPALLRDLRTVATDTPAMIAALRAAADALDATASDDPESSEQAELLRWLADSRFTLLGATHPDEPDATHSTGLGMLGPHASARVELPAHDTSRPALHLSAGSVNTLLPGAPGLYVLSVATTTGDWVFLGTFTGAAVHENILDIPLVSRRAREVIARSGFEPNSFSGKAMLEVMQSYPRAELLRTDTTQLFDIVTAVMNTDLRTRVRTFVREHSDTVSCLLYLPRDRYTSAVRERMEQILYLEFGGEHISYSARVTEFDLAVVHFTVHRIPGSPPADLSVPAQQRLEQALFAATRTWSDQFGALAAADPTFVTPEGTAPVRFPLTYQQEHPPQRALDDLRRLTALRPGQITTDLRPRVDTGAGLWRFTLYVVGEAVSLSRVLPVLQSLGVEVLDERPYRITLGPDRDAWIYDFSVRSDLTGDLAIPRPLESLDTTSREELCDRFTAAFTTAWTGRTDVDGLNALVLRAGLDWPRILVLRAYAKYLRQTGFPYSFAAITRVLAAHPAIARGLTDLFHAAFDPDADSHDQVETLATTVRAEIDSVAELDADRVLRALLATISATLRTNHFRYDHTDPRAEQLALKLDAQRIDELPRPRPQFEIFVYSPRVEGVHLRVGAVARGGIRWSDRLTDYRTEILGLVKAQEVKNAVIVPVGAKGGFVVKHPPAGTDRAAVLAEGRECYRRFIAALLDLTDSIDQATGAVTAPTRVRRRDSDDPYLVVAADKGTATFSDLANELAADYGFWLGDAFASGGSAGYDHKQIGITARGAWESVRRHFAELDLDVDHQPFTVVGIGDMSGDVFGNGMLRSSAIRLVAAFDHRHIFIDPDPDPERSFLERTRLFGQSRSSWADYDISAVSAGGGVFDRTAKQIPLTARMRRALDIPDHIPSMTPAELIRAILTAPVDLLFNGGIGTYIKASTESDAEVADKSNDALRVDADQVRAKVIGEGGNLGLTARARIEYCQQGGRCNTDAVDNAAGVNCSDHEVNIKIVLDAAVSAAQLPAPDRNPLLAALADEVATAVVDNTVAGNNQLGRSRRAGASILPAHARLLDHLESCHGLDRDLEALPTPAEISRRLAGARGLTSPELATLTAHTKLALKNELLAGSLPDDPAFEPALLGYFPREIADRFAALIARHPLRREITTTVVVNDLVDTTGPEFVYELLTDTDASTEAAVQVFHAVAAIFELRPLWQDIRAADLSVHAADMLELETLRLLERAARWMLADRHRVLIANGYHAPIQLLIRQSELWLPERASERIQRAIITAAGHGVPAELAERVYRLIHLFPLLDIVDAADTVGRPPTEVAQLYFALDHHLGIDDLLTAVRTAQGEDRWQRLARRDVHDDLHSALRALALDVARVTDAGLDAQTRVQHWHSTNTHAVTRARRMVDDLLADTTVDVTALAVAARRVLAVAGAHDHAASTL
ncbi:NAD-glutamate dehydrogenase [Nocardia acididurans]|uniref:NAD-glutamate dehydrogenase n=1 Tax=Nocardia acididurans TaxID=2802282 RepID=UPI0027DE8DA3|nr:NAD-glutamate dehydrogenase domain-containing protein [Nocardia acididurans]